METINVTIKLPKLKLVDAINERRIEGEDVVTYEDVDKIMPQFTAWLSVLAEGLVLQHIDHGDDEGDLCTQIMTWLDRPQVED